MKHATKKVTRNEVPQRHVSIPNLPFDIVFHLIPFLSACDIIALRLVDKAHYAVFTSDIVCRQALRCLFWDCHELYNMDRDKLGASVGTEQEMFDRVYLRRERFRQSNPTALTVLSRRLEYPHCPYHLLISEREGLLFYLDSFPTAESCSIEIRDLRHGSADDYISTSLLDPVSPLDGAILSQFNTVPLDVRKELKFHDFYHFKAPLIAAQDGALLVGCHYNENISIYGCSMAVISTRPQSRGSVLQMWTAPRLVLHEDLSGPIGAINRHYVVYKEQDFESGHPYIVVLPLLERALGQKELSHEEYTEHAQYVELPSGLCYGRAYGTLGADHDGKLFFHAVGRSNTPTGIEVYAVDSFSHGTPRKPQRIALVPLWDLEAYWQTERNAQLNMCASFSRYQPRAYGFSCFSDPPWSAVGTRQGSIAFTMTTKLRNIPQYSIFLSPAAAVWVLPTDEDSIRKLMSPESTMDENVWFHEYGNEGLMVKMRPTQGFVCVEENGAYVSKHPTIHNIVSHAQSRTTRSGMKHSDNYSKYARYPFRFGCTLPRTSLDDALTVSQTLPFYWNNNCGCYDHRTTYEQGNVSSIKIPLFNRLQRSTPRTRLPQKEYRDEQGKEADYEQLQVDSNEWYVDLKIKSTGIRQQGRSSQYPPLIKSMF